MASWDGDSADPVPSWLVDVAEGILSDLEYEVEPNVSPSFEGEVDLTWPNLALSLDLSDFGYNYNLGRTIFKNWEDATDIPRCVKQVVTEVQPLIQ